MRITAEYGCSGAMWWSTGSGLENVEVMAGALENQPECAESVQESATATADTVPADPIGVDSFSLIE